MPSVRVRRQRRGLTILEVIVAVALFGVLAIIASSLLISSMRSYARGKVLQDLRKNTNFAIYHMQSDISRSVFLPVTDLSEHQKIPSGVLVPNPYGVGNGQASGDTGGGTSTNRLVLVLTNLPADSVQPPTRPQDFQYVEYVVYNTAPNVMRRRVYSGLGFTGNGYSGFAPDTVASVLGGKWFFNDGGASGLLSKDEVIVQLPSNNDEINFTVARPPLLTTIELNNPYNVTHQRNLFRIDLRMTSYVYGDVRQSITFNETTDAQSTLTE